MEQFTCDTGKLTFKNYGDGIDKIKSLSQRKKGKYKLYKCERCKCFHITTITKTLNTPKKIDKYPIKPEDIKIPKEPKIKAKKKPDNKPKTQPVYLTTTPLLSKEQTQALKRIIDNNILKNQTNA